jgi:serine/threonine-protein kinase
MGQTKDEIVLTRLVERGHLTADAVEKIRVDFETAATVVGSRSDHRPSLLDCLIESELVAPDLIADLAREIMVDLSSDDEPDEGFPVRGLDRFECLGLIGAGGMGQVFKARDLELDRIVAIKFFHSGDEHLRRRFAVEARAQAKVSHPNVCEVFDVGQIDGRQYIVMQFIDGASLKELASGLPLERIVRLIRDVATAVHAAHRTGLIHRDLKPGNVMVSTVGDEPPCPYVVDFGIAHDANGPEMTVTGDLLGSPAFMAPEQARSGSTIDRRTDVYALGATLYSVLTGRPPHQGKNAFDTLMKVQLDDPVPPRRVVEAIPVDLESIVLKALEKEPARRYQSAQDLSDDLDRFLDGRPVAARPVGPWRRTVKWTRRHRTLTVGLTVLLLSALIATGLGIRGAAQARERQRLTLLFGTEAQRLDAMMRIAHLLPLHDITPEKQRVRDRMRWILDQQNGVRGDARAPGWYALGRGHLVLEEFRPARELLSKAWEADFRSPDVAYAYGLALARTYDREISAAGQIPDREQRSLRRAEVRKEFRDPAVEMFEAATDVEGVAKSYVLGLLALYEEDYERAMESARETIDHAPQQVEAWLLLGEAALRKVGQARDRGDEAGVEIAISTADTAFVEAARLGRSDPLPNSRLCTLWGMVMGMRLYGGGGDLQMPLERAVSSCDRALTADPSRIRERHNKAICYRQMAEYAIRTGENPIEFLEKGRASIREILEMDSENVAAHINLSDSYAVALVWWTGLDSNRRPVPVETAIEWSRLGVEHGLAAVENEPDGVGGYRALGTAAMMRSGLLMDAGLDPSETMLMAESAYERAMDLDPTSVSVANNHAWALYQQAQFKIRRGGNPESELARCIRSAERSLELKPNHTSAMNILGRAHVLEARARRIAGRDPSESLDSAQATFETMIETNPEMIVARVGLVSVEAERGLRAAAIGEDVSPFVSRGLAVADAIRGETTAIKGLRWDFAVLKLLAAEEAPSAARSRRLAGQAMELLDQISIADRLPEWEQQRTAAVRMARR